MKFFPVEKRRHPGVKDDHFFSLTLIAIAEELAARGAGDQELYHIQFAVGLPPAHFGARADRLIDYFQGRGIVEYVYQDKHYASCIDNVACDSRAYAAAATMLHSLMDDLKALVLDLLLDESDVDAILTGKQTKYPVEAVRLVEQLAQEFVNDLFSTLRERMLDLRFCKEVFVGAASH